MVKGDAVSCEQVWREISSYLEGDVAPPLRAAIDGHFLICPRCRSVLEGTRNVIRLYGDDRMIEVPSGYSRRLEKRLVRSAASRQSDWWSLSAWLIPVAALALFTAGLRWANSLTIEHPLLSEHAQPANNIPPDMTVVVSEGARDFHVPGCKFIHNKNKERTLTAREAIREGYVPCVRCMRKYLQTASRTRSLSEPEENAEAEVEKYDPQRGSR